jgi:hypothetical protein
MARKYREGEVFKTAGEVVDWLSAGGSVYLRGKFQHNGWARSWQINYVINEVRREVLSKAIINKPKDAPHLGLVYEQN